MISSRPWQTSADRHELHATSFRSSLPEQIWFYRTGTPRGVRHCDASDGLLDGDALGQVARLVHIAAATKCDVIREQLERDDRHKRSQQLGGRGNLDDVLGLPGGGPIIGVRDRDEHTLARAHLLHVAEHALVGRVAGHQHDDGQAVGNEGTMGPCFISPPA